MATGKRVVFLTVGSKANSFNFWKQNLRFGFCFTMLAYVNVFPFFMNSVFNGPSIYESSMGAH